MWGIYIFYDIYLRANSKYVFLYKCVCIIGCGKLTSFFVWHFIFKKGRFYSLGMVAQIIRFDRFAKNAERSLLLKCSHLGVQMLLLAEQSAKHCLTLERLWTRFGLVTGFIILFYVQRMATLRNTLLHARTIASTVMSSLLFHRSAFQASNGGLSLLLGSQTVSMPQLQQLRSYTHFTRHCATRHSSSGLKTD
jgi:hypothetical protein